MKPQCNTSADCLRELARVMDQFGILSIYDAIHSTFILHCGYCYNGSTKWVGTPQFENPHDWKFAIAAVEGKPVFIGDELFDADGIHATVTGFDGQLFEVEIPKGKYVTTRKSLTWNPPKPATVMVEMEVKDAMFIADAYAPIDDVKSHLERASIACAIALEKLKS